MTRQLLSLRKACEKTKTLICLTDVKDVDSNLTSSSCVEFLLALPIKRILTPQRRKLSSLFFQVISNALRENQVQGWSSPRPDCRSADGSGATGRGYQDDLDTDWLLEMMATVKQQTASFVFWCLVWVNERCFHIMKEDLMA